MTILNSWVILALLGAVAASLGTIFAKIGLQDVPSHIVTTVRGVVMAIVVTLVTLFISKKVSMQSITELPTSAWIFIILSAVCGAISWLLFFQSLALGPVQGVTVLDKLSLIFTLVLAALFLGEAFTIQTIIGGLLVLIGTLLVALPSEFLRLVGKLFS